MVDSHLSSMMEIKKVLTPEQFAGYMALEKEKHMMKRHDRRESHEHGGDKLNKDDDADGQD
jgi:Spy/CpxP family protein refolding chaperone